MSKSLKQLVVQALSISSTPLTNSQIRGYVQSRRPGTSASSVDSVLSQISKEGTINKQAATGLGKAKNVYSLPKAPTVTNVIQAGLTGSKQDSLQVYLVVKSVLPTVSKNSVDSALYSLAKANKIQRSKNPMTDSNTISTQSKFLYSL